MTIVDVVAMPPEDDEQSGKYDYSRLPESLRIPAMTAEGVVVQGLRSAVERVVEAGKALMWAKDVFPHGEYLPWVRACGLKPQQASKLIKAAEFSNVVHAQHLDGITDTTTLFLLSADATPDDVRQWAMDRCAAGDPPSRKEVQERKRRPQGRQDRSLIQEALSALKLSSEARDLAAKAEQITTRQLMQELNVDELPGGREHSTDCHVYCKAAAGWWKFPQAKAVDVMAAQHLPVAEAAERMGFAKRAHLSNRLTPSAIKRYGLPRRNGLEAKPSETSGMCYLAQSDQQPSS